MKKIYLFTLFLLLTITLNAQRNYLITKSVETPKLDGKLELEFWGNIPVTDSFTTALPSFGRTPIHATTVQMVFTSTGIYIGFDCQSNKIRYDLSQRDQIGTGDYCSVGLDTWNDDQNAFLFTVTAGGQRADARVSSTLIDQDYDTYWIAKTDNTVNGWSAEFFIPFNALRFPVGERQNWGLQFTRFDRSTGELSTWNPQNPLIEDAVLQYGQLEAYSVTKQKRRLGLMLNGAGGINIDSLSNRELFNGAAIDAKFGINSATTIDVSLLPDLTDKYDYTTMVNTVPYPTISAFDKQPFVGILPRQGMQEEAGIFEKSSILDQKRDISSLVYLQTTVLSTDWGYSATGSQLLNRARFTTRTRNNIGIGISQSVYEHPDVFIYLPRNTFNGGIQKTSLGIKNLPYYNNISVEKNFRNNSWVQLSNSFNFLTKQINSNRSALSGQLRDKNNKFELYGTLKVQTQKGSTAADGHIAIEKINAKWTYGAAYKSADKTKSGLLLQREGYEFPQKLDQFSAFISKRNYTSRKWLQNTEHRLFSHVMPQKNAIDGPIAQLSYRFNAIDHHYRKIAIASGMNLSKEYQKIEIGSSFISRKSGYPSYINLFVTSDERKLFVCTFGARQHWNYGTNISHTAFHINPYWVLHPKFFIQTNLMAIRYKNEIQSLPTSISDRNFATRNKLAIINQLSFTFGGKNINIQGFIDKNFTSDLNKNYYTFTSNFQIEDAPDNGDSPKVNANSTGYGVNLRWFFNNTSQAYIRFYQKSRVLATFTGRDSTDQNEESFIDLVQFHFGLTYNLFNL